MDLLLLALHPVIFPAPGVSRVFIDSQIARRLGNRLLRLDGEFYCTLLACGRIISHCGCTHRPHLSSGTSVRVSVCPEEYSHINGTRGKSAERLLAAFGVDARPHNVAPPVLIQEAETVSLILNLGNGQTVSLGTASPALVEGAEVIDVTPEPHVDQP